MNFEVEYNKSLKIFSQLYVGVKPKPQNGGTPLAFATPYEENAAGRKRQETVKGWVGDTEYIWDPKTRRSTARKYEPDLRVIENTPRSGFKVTDEVKRVYWGGGNVVWRIEDPDGWEVEIQSNNLMALLQAVGIQTGGEINGECIWARDGAQNILIPVTSQEYKDAVKTAEAAKPPAKIPMKDRVLGRFYRLQDGSFGQYLGKFYITEARSLEIAETNLGITVGTARLGVQAEIVGEEVLNGEQAQYEVLYTPPHEQGANGYKYKVGGSLRLYKSAALVSELDQGTLDEDTILRIVAENTLTFAGNQKTRPLLATRQKPTDVEIRHVPISKKEFNERLKSLVERETEEQNRHDRYIADGYWKNRVPPVQPARPKVSCYSFFLHGHVALLQGTGVYAYGNNVKSYLGDRHIADLLGRVLPRNGNKFQIVKPKDYHARVWKVGNTGPWDSEKHIYTDGFVLPQFNAVDEMKAYVTRLFENGLLLKKQAKEIT